MAAAPDHLHPADNGGQFDAPGRSEDISDWTKHLSGQDMIAVGGQLPPHSSHCSGCGPDNPAGLHLRAFRTATGVQAVHSFSDLHQGAPGIAHGGAVALAFDDLFGFALYTVGLLAVTRGLTVDYQAPFRLHHPYTFHAEVAEQTGRRLLLHGDAWNESGSKVGFADATFIVVDPAHFVAPNRTAP